MSTQIVNAMTGEFDPGSLLSVLRWCGNTVSKDPVMFTICIENGEIEPQFIDLSRREMVELISKLVEGLVV